MFVLLGVVLMVAGTARREMATVFAASAHFAMGALLVTVDLLSDR